MNIPWLSPYAFHVFGFGVHWYGIAMAASILAGAVYIVRAGGRAGLNEDALSDVVMWAVVGGIVGARLIFVATSDPGWFWHDPMQILHVWQGGLAWDGGLLGGVLAGYVAARRRHMPVQKLLDLSVPGLALGYVLVRISDIFNHDELGRFSVLLDTRWPAQVVSVAIGAFLLWRYFAITGRYPKLPAGYQFWTFNLWYQALRAVVEETVRQNPLYLWHYVNPYLGIGIGTMEQWFSPLIILFVAWMLMVAQALATRQGDEMRLRRATQRASRTE
ncbi:MAG: prolipoprotein diacylglyceryl transferase [Thermaerobacter sp.]|nr:prolipoprotein diacylglyceryl transferase [Thermaerobacter sp.]